MKRKITRVRPDGSKEIEEIDDEAPALQKASQQPQDPKAAYLQKMKQGGAPPMMQGQQGNIAAQGQGGDTELAHVNKWEEALLEKLDGAGTRNPQTGLKQFYTKDDISSWYTNALGRSPDQGGLDYWTGQTQTLSDADLWKAFNWSASNTDPTLGTVANEPTRNAAWTPDVNLDTRATAGTWSTTKPAGITYPVSQPEAGYMFEYNPSIVAGRRQVPDPNFPGTTTYMQPPPETFYPPPPDFVPGASAITTPIVNTPAPYNPATDASQNLIVPGVGYFDESGINNPNVPFNTTVPGMGTSTNQPVTTSTMPADYDAARKAYMAQLPADVMYTQAFMTDPYGGQWSNGSGGGFQQFYENIWKPKPAGQPPVKTAGPNTATGTDIRPGTTGYVAPTSGIDFNSWYQNAYGRPADPAGLAYLKAQEAAGVPAAQLWNAFVNAGKTPQSKDIWSGWNPQGLTYSPLTPVVIPTTTVAGGTGIDLPLNIMPTSGSTNTSTSNNQSTSGGVSTSTQGAANYSGLPATFQEQLLNAIIPQLTNATTNMGANYDKYTNEALGSYQQMMQNALRKNIPAALGGLANRGILSSTEGNKVLSDVFSNAATDASTKGYTTAMQAALLKANMPQVLAQLADLGKTSYGASQGASNSVNAAQSTGTSTSAGSSFSQDPTRMYSELASIIRAMM